VTSPRDDIDDWLGNEVEPLYPPPGELERIRRRARHRKTRQAVVAAAGCAVVLAAAVSVPQLVRGGGHRGPSPLAASPKPASSSVQPSASHPAAPSSSATPTSNNGTQIPQLQFSTLSTTTSGAPPPPHLRPTSVTFVGNNAGGVVGAVIGQAGPPCATKYCTSLAGTSDYGTSWYGVSAPYAYGPNDGTGVSQLRFANLRDGWAFGPALYETSGGGWPWRRESTGGQRVIDIEAAAGGPALGLFATCTGTGPAYGANCTSFSLNTSVAGSRTWTPVTVPAGTLSTGHAASAELVVTGVTGYLLTPTGAVVTGPVSGGTWRLAGQAPCVPGPAQPSGWPTQALLATSPHQLMLACAAGSTGGPSSSGPLGLTNVYTSANGSTWQLAGSVKHPTAATSLASGTAGQLVLATTAGIYKSGDSGKTWRLSSLAGAAPPGGFSYVGMTNAKDGVAVPADAALGVIYVSTDGGLRWQPRRIA
jgi:hypothetical protein